MAAKKNDPAEFGPQGEAVAAIIEKFSTLTNDERQRLYELRDQAFWDAWSVADDGRADRAGLDAAQGALCVRLSGWLVGSAAYGAALAVLLRHTIDESFTREHYDALVKPWVTVIGSPAHPDDVVPKVVEVVDVIPSSNEWSDLTNAERARQIEMGYTAEHDAQHGVDHILMWAQDYARRGKAVESSAMIEAARELLLRERLAR